MKVLIADDDPIITLFMKKFLSRYGQCDVVDNGIDAIDAYLDAINKGDGYNLICLDIMMRRLDGMKTLKYIRNIEEQKGIETQKRVKIIITTSLNDKATVLNAYNLGCETYVLKPIDIDKFIIVMKNLGLKL